MNQIELVKFKRKIKHIQSIQGYGTGLISVFIKPGTNLADTQRILTNEENSASNIKDASNRRGVITSIQSARGLIKTYRQTPRNGLVIYSGVGTADTREQKVLLALEPPKPVPYNNQICDTYFDTAPLEGMLQNSLPYGFVIIDGGGFIIAVVQGKEQRVLAKTSVQLPRKHNKGGQSAARFGRLRLAALKHYKKSVVETMNRVFINPSTAQPIIERIIVAGSAEMKFDITGHSILDSRLVPLFLAPLTIEYGGNRGLDTAVAGSAQLIGDYELSREREVLQEFYDLLHTAPDKLVFGARNVICGLRDGILERVIINQDDMRTLGEADIGGVGEAAEAMIDWVLDGDHGAVQIDVVSPATAEGTQFVMGFDGIAGVLRYGVADDQAAADAGAGEDDEEFI